MDQDDYQHMFMDLTDQIWATCRKAFPDWTDLLIFTRFIAMVFHVLKMLHSLIPFTVSVSLEFAVDDAVEVTTQNDIAGGHQQHWEPMEDRQPFVRQSWTIHVHKPKWSDKNVMSTLMKQI